MITITLKTKISMREYPSNFVLQISIILETFHAVDVCNNLIYPQCFDSTTGEPSVEMEGTSRFEKYLTACVKAQSKNKDKRR